MRTAPLWLAAASCAALLAPSAAQARRCWMLTYVTGNTYVSLTVERRKEDADRMLTYDEIRTIVSQNAAQISMANPPGNGLGQATPTGVFEVSCPKRE